MSGQVWSLALAAVGITGLLLAGRARPAIGWAVGLAAQLLWVGYALATRQYGFLASAGAYGTVYGLNLRRALRRGVTAPVELADVLALLECWWCRTLIPDGQALPAARRNRWVHPGACRDREAEYEAIVAAAQAHAVKVNTAVATGPGSVAIAGDRQAVLPSLAARWPALGGPR